MPIQNPDTEHATLGDFFRETRDQQALTLNAVADQTKISLKNLQAIENDDFNALPAEAFTRGIYTLYAKALSLDPAHILQRYSREKPARKHAGRQEKGSGNQLHDVGLMAERPSALPLATFGLALFCLLLAGGFFCWYFSWNPATYLSYKLRSLQDPAPQVEQATKSSNVPVVPDPLSFFRSAGRKKHSSYDLFTLPAPTSATAAVPKPQKGSAPPSLATDSPDASSTSGGLHE